MLSFRPKPSRKTLLNSVQRFNPNRVRDHLANERTYLAWMRTAIALLGFGVLIVRLRILQPPFVPQPPGTGWKLGLVFSLVGLITIWFSAQRYFTIRRNIERDTYEPADGWIVVSTLALMLLGVGVVYYVFSAPLSALSNVIIE